MDLMLDTETLALGTRPVIMTIGLVPFDPKGTGTGQGLYLQLDPQAVIDAGLDVDWSTIHFWLTKTTEEARQALPQPGKGMPLTMALTLLSLEFDKYPEAHLWSNGAAADVPWLESLYRAVGMKVPWKYNKVLDVRTMKWLTGGLVPQVSPLVPHHAMWDAQAQTIWVQEMYEHLKIWGLGAAAPLTEEGKEEPPPKAEVGGTPAEATVDAPVADVNDRVVGVTIRSPDQETWEKINPWKPRVDTPFPGEPEPPNKKYDDVPF